MSIRNCRPKDPPQRAVLRKKVESEQKKWRQDTWGKRTDGHKKREPINGSLLANRIKYTRFSPKNQALAFPHLALY